MVRDSHHFVTSERRLFNTMYEFVAGAFRFETLLIAVLLLASTLLGPSEATAAPSVPNGFKDELVVSVGSPTDIAFSPGGRLVVTTQGGVLYVKSGNSMVTALNLSGSICSDFERGMLGVAFDPDFSSNSYIYIFYTYNKLNTCVDNSASSPVNRVSRFTMSGNTVNAGSETVLIDNMPSPNGNHNAGDLLFGKDGFLYVSIGDGGCELNNASFCGGQNKNALKNNVLTGKVLRITSSGGIPSTNPFRGSDSGRCNVTGKTTKTYCQETFLSGLRNPFRIAADPNVSGTKIYVNDVGQNIWEEIDLAISGANYGWNCREGFNQNNSSATCSIPTEGFTNPVFAYQHDGSGCNSITGGAFVPNNLWSPTSTYNGSYLYADYVCGKIFRLKGGTSTLFASNLGPVTTLQFGPDGNGTALYYASYAGEIRKISTNLAPVAVAKATPKFGTTPLLVSFDGTDSTDPDNAITGYAWDFNDGSVDEAGSGATITHTFQEDGVYEVVLKVTDAGGRTDTETVTIDAGNTPPVPVIANPGVSDTFSVGETITLQGSAADAQDGAISPSTLKWEVRLHHGSHDHPLFSATGNNLEFEAPAPEDLLAAGNSYLSITLTATDETGLSASVTQNLLPNKVDLRVESEPSGLKVQIEGVAYTTPAEVITWAGNTIDLSAPDQLIASGEPVSWESWSVPGDQNFQYVMPTVDTIVTANFDLVTAPSFIPVADARVRESSPSLNEGSSTALTVKGGSSSDFESDLRFDVTGLIGSVTSAKIYFYANEGTSDGPFIYKAVGSWTEGGVTWSNKPRTSGGRLDDAGTVPSGTWFALDVTGAINGNGTYNFLLRSSSTDSISIYSRESSSRQPRLVVETNGGSGDSIAPATPTQLSADAPESGKVVLKWNASTDNVLVTGYDVFRNGVLLTTTASNSFVDTGVKPSEEYSYRVRARDAASNVSGLSTTASVDTPARTATLTFLPVGDTYVVESSPTTNYSRKTVLRVEGGSDPDSVSYLSFTVNGLPGAVYRSTLRIFVPTGSGNGTGDGPELHRTNTNWTESAINWSNKPAWSLSAAGDAGATVAGTWVEYDVSAIVIKNGNYGWALVSISTDLAVFSSSNGANPPQLVVSAFTTGSASAAEVIADSPPAQTPTATQTPAPTATPVATLPITDGFESGDLAGWTVTGDMTVTDAIAKTGSRSAVARSDGSSGAPSDGASASRELPSAVDEVFVASSIFVDRRGEYAVNLITLSGPKGVNLLSVIVDSDGNLAVLNERTGKSAPIRAIQSDQWFDLKVHLVSAGSSSQVEIWLDDDLVYREGQRLSRRQIAAVLIGDKSTDRTFTVAFDDVVIDTRCIGTCSSELITPTPESTAVSETPTEEATTVATQEPQPTQTAEPTIEPTQEPTVEPTPEPTETPEPTAEPEPTEEPTSDTGG